MIVDGTVTTRSAAWRTAWIFGILFSIAMAVLVIVAPTPERIRVDQNEYHIPAIRTFAAQWPAPDLRDYKSATTPGYHLVMAVASKVVGADERPLRFLSIGFSLALVVVLAAFCVRRAGNNYGILWALPTACSPYVIASAGWVLPDNAAWLGVLLVLLLGLNGRLDARSILASSCILVALVWTRQIHIWTVAPLLAAAWLGNGVALRSDPSPPLLSRWEQGVLLLNPFQSTARCFAVGLAAVPAVACLVWFMKMWGGLVPPQFQSVLHGGNPATPAFVLSLLGIYSVALAPLLWPAFRGLVREHLGLLALAVVVGLAMAIVPATTAVAEAGRWTGLWQIVVRTPVLFSHTSALILILAPIGAVAAVTIASSLSIRDRWTWLAALVGFTAAQSANHACWQRYIEPLLLMLVAIAGACIAGDSPRAAGRPLARLAPIALSALLAVLAALSIFGQS